MRNADGDPALALMAPMRERMQNPYNRLYIYYLEGCLAKDSPLSGEGFIGNWEEEGQSFLFFTRPSRKRVNRLLETQPHLKLQDEYRMSYEEWQGGPVIPLRIGRIRVTPPWAIPERSPAESAAPEESLQNNTIDILLDPGVVFGNGTHPTTRHCIEALEELFSDNQPEKVLDLGTGTGLLAIAAARLGCRCALAVDLNLLAVKTALENIRLNRLEDRVLALQGNAENFVDLSSDLVISNIHYDVMKHLVGSRGFLSKKYFILSGLLRNQATQIEILLNRYSVEIVKKWEHQGIWYSYLGKSA